MKLYELANDYQAVMDELTETDGELTPDLEQRLAAIDAEIGPKVNGVCAMYETLLRQSEAAKASAERLTSLARSRSNAADNLKHYLKIQMERMGMAKHETDLFKVRVQASPPSCNYFGKPEDLPAELRVVKVEPNKKAALAIWREAPEKLPEGFQVTQGTHLRIQ